MLLVTFWDFKYQFVNCCRTCIKLTEHNKSALTDHATHGNHVINWSQATVIKQRARVFYQMDQRGHTHPKGRTTVTMAATNRLTHTTAFLTWRLPIVSTPEELSISFF